MTPGISLALYESRYRAAISGADGSPRRPSILYESNHVPGDTPTPPGQGGDSKSWLLNLLGRRVTAAEPIDAAICNDTLGAGPLSSWFSRAFPAIRHVSPVAAALRAFLASTSSVPARVIVIAAAEESTEVVTFTLDSSRRVVRVVERKNGALVLQGNRAILDRVLGGLQALMAEPIDCLAHPKLRQSATEFVASLCGVPSGSPVGWSGFLASRLFQPFRLTPLSVLRWEESSAIWSEATAAVHRAAISSSDQIVVAGPGSIWPWWQQLRSVGPVWTSQRPADDLALGAAMLALADDPSDAGPVEPSPPFPADDATGDPPSGRSAPRSKPPSSRLPFLAGPLKGEIEENDQ